MSNLRWRWVFRRDEIQDFLRIIRVCWERGVPGEPGGGYSAKFSVALDRHLFRWFAHDGKTDWRLTVFEVRLHYCRSYAGIFG